MSIKFDLLHANFMSPEPRYLLGAWTMKPLISFAGVVALVLATGMSSSGAVTPGGSHYSTAQLKQMIREAHTPEQYTAIARYYDERHSEFSQKAADAKVEWERRSQNTSGPAAKYPRPVDVAHNLYEYYVYRADDAALQADKYYHLASGTTTAAK
jgi:hypothetical protein